MGVCVLPLAALLTVACGPTEDKEAEARSDARPGLIADASPETADAAPPVQCVPGGEVPSSYGTSGLKSANNPWNEVGEYWEVSATLEGAGGPTLELRLYPGRGQLADPIVPGSYTIGAADSVFETCALCAYVKVGTGSNASIYMANSGTLDITTIAFGDVVDVIEGALVEAAFVAVDLTATGASCQPSDECGNASCGSNGMCLTQESSNTCGTTVGMLSFRTP